LSKAPTLGHRFWLAVRPTTIPTCPPSIRIAHAVAFLATQGDYITGEVIAIDGGLHM